MKKLFMIIFIPVLLILGTPALVATLMYDGSGLENLPVHLYTDEYDALEMVYEELDTSITEVEDGTTEDLLFNLSQDVINRAIYEAILETNPDYAPGTDCTTDEECFVFSEAQEIEGYNISFRLVGAWVSFYEGASATAPGKFVLNVMAEINIDDSMSYQTVLEVHMLFDDDPDYYYLEFDKIQMGNLPLPKSIFTTIIGVAENQADLDIQSEVDSNVPMGDFDLDNLSYTIQKDDILTEIAASNEGNDDAGFMLMQELLSIIFDNQLIQFEIQDTEFIFKAGVSQFRSDATDIPAYLYDLHDQEVVGTETIIGEYNADLFDPEAYLTDVFTTYIFNSSLLGGGFEIEEEIFNKLIYSGAGGFADTRDVQSIQISATETKEIELGLKAIWFEFEDEDIKVKALFRIAGIDSLLEIVAEEVSLESNVTELKFEFTTITFGNDSNEDENYVEPATEYLEILDLSVFKQVFADLGDVEFGEFNSDGDLIISAARLSALMQDGSTDAVEVTGISLQENAIVLEIEAADPELQETLEAFQTALQDVIESEELVDNLEEVLDFEDGGVEEDVYNSVVALQEELADPEGEVTPEQVEDLMENFEELDPETQTEFLETIGDLIPEDLYGEFGDIFGNFDQTGDGE